MSRQKETVTLPAVSKTAQLGVQMTTTAYHRINFTVKQNVKRLSLWYKTWRIWQKRVFICRVMEHCSKQHLEFLATALEPILHLDFSSSLVPHMAALHLDGVATFQVQRSIMQSVVRTETEEGSLAYLNSIPTTLLTDSTDGRKIDPSASQFTMQGSDVAMVTREPKPKKEILLPVLPLTHVEHAGPLSSQNPSMEASITLHRKRFSSVPDFKSTTDLLRNVRHKELKKRKHKRSRSLGVYSTGAPNGDRSAEHFKTQLALLSDWMGQWQPPQCAFLLLEMVKLCDRDLLGYLVQCLYQRLQNKVNVESLPDSILLEIFSYLDPHSLCRCSQVCQRWRHLCSSPDLWRSHCSVMGRGEGVGDLVRAVEVGHGGGDEESRPTIDWKRAYRDLSKVMARIKTLVIKAAGAVEAVEHQKSPPKLTSAALRAKFSLKEMIELVRAKTPGSTRAATTQEVVRSAPESAATTRRRLRSERRIAQELREREEQERVVSSRYQHRRPGDRQTPMQSISPTGHPTSPEYALYTMHEVALAESKSIGVGGGSSSSIELVQVALDKRPSIPYLPDPDGVQCLILAGCLMAEETPKPGRMQPIPRLRRIKFDSTVLCLQCDQRKIVSGTSDREIHIHDIRTGRHVQTLLGHKGSVQCLQYDDYKIVSGSWDSTCIVWDVVHFTAIKVLHGHSSCISCLQFNEETLVTGSYDKSLRMWSTSSWECIVVIGSTHKGAITCLRFNDSVVASGSTDKSVKLWSLHTGHCTATLEHDSPITALQLSNLLLVVACDNGGVSLWNLSSHSALMEWGMNGGHLGDLAGAGSKFFGAGSDSVLYEWDIATGTCTRTLTGHSRPLTSIWAGDHKLVTAAKDCTVCVWYCKKSLSKGDDESDEIEPAFMDVPIRVLTE